ncbi:MAG TPA: cell division protein FtsK [Flavobacteriales bacterium]|nr:cell division protein FtsK [Flavobacteriales bacterium]|tara:strand:- start:28771 stop:31305 length:2535 start_codon:yes stop_codon:yes gene_type:complete
MGKNTLKNKPKKNNIKKEKPVKEKSLPKLDFTKINALVQNKKFKQISGIGLIVLSVFLLLAIASYFFSWKYDQDKLYYGWDDILFNPELRVNNWLGKMGAVTAHLLVYKWFGIAAFIIPYLTAVLGFKILFPQIKIPVSKSFKHAAFLLIFISLAMGIVAHHQPVLSGGLGYFGTEWLYSVFGKIGTAILMLFVLTVYVIINFNIEAIYQKLFPAKEQEETIEGNNEVTDDIEQTPQNPDEDKYQLNVIDDGEVEKEHSPIEGETIPLSTSETKTTPENEETNTEEKQEEYSNEVVFDDIPTKIEKTKSINDENISFEVETTEEKEVILSDKEVNKKIEEFGEYDPTLDLSSYQFPTIDLLKEYSSDGVSVDANELENNKNQIVNTLLNYNIKIESIKATVGPTVTLYEIIPAPGVRISKIKNLEDDIALSLAALGIRIIAPMPGKGTIGIEVPNKKPKIVSMRSVIASEKFQNAKMELPVVMGKTISNEIFTFDLAKMPHLLMAGATGQGKSVGLNAILTSLLYKKHPSQLKFVLVDPKKVELTLYNKIERHFLAKLPDSEEAIITDNSAVVTTLNSLCVEMDDRYQLLKEAMVRNIVEYNAKFKARKLNPNNGHRYLPYIVVVIDEFADLIMTAGKEVEQPIARLAQLARAIGIHLIVATQRPSTNVITGVIKANFPGRIAFRVTSQIDSRTILDSKGAEQLIGRGDMLFSQGSDLTRVQCAFVDTPEVENICDFIGNQRGYPSAFILPEYSGDTESGITDIDMDDRDEMFEEAARVIVEHQQGSTSLIQRKLKLGYNRAGRIIDQLEAAGIVGPFKGSKARDVLITDLISLEQYLEELKNK